MSGSMPRWAVLFPLLVVLGFLGCKRTDDLKSRAPADGKNEDKANPHEATPSPADNVMKEMIQVTRDLADAHRDGAPRSKVAQLEGKLAQVNEKLAALNLSEEDAKKLTERHKGGMRKAMAKLAIYGRYNLTGDRSRLLAVSKEEKLTGSWIATHNPDAGVKFFGDDMAMTDKRAIIPATFKLDSTRKPKTIDITLLIPYEGKSLVLGIYDIDDYTLKLCQGEPGGNRPSEFKDGPGQRLRIFKRSR